MKRNYPVLLAVMSAAIALPLSDAVAQADVTSRQQSATRRDRATLADTVTSSNTATPAYNFVDGIAMTVTPSSGATTNKAPAPVEKDVDKNHGDRNDTGIKTVEPRADSNGEKASR